MIFFKAKILNALAVTHKLDDAQMSQMNSWSSRKIDVWNRVCVKFWDVEEKIKYQKNMKS